MAIDKEDWENFYRGNCAEQIVCSKASFHGFESYKYNPDFGLDIIITNKARQKYREEGDKEFNVQVKSSLVTKSKAYFSIKKEDLATLQSQKNPILVICLFEGVFIGEPSLSNNMDSYAQTIHSIDDWLDKSWASQQFDSQFVTPRWKDKEEYNKNREAANNSGLDSFNEKIFWLNSKQINRAIELDILRVKANGDYFMVIYKNEDGAWYFESHNHKEYYPFPEISHFSYLLLDRVGYGLEMSEFAQEF